MCSPWTSPSPPNTHAIAAVSTLPRHLRHSQNSLSVTFKLWLALGSGDVCETFSGQHWRQACVWGTFGCQTHFLSSSLFSLWLLSFPLRCPSEFTGDRCQNYVMASFYSTSISSSCLCLDWSMLSQRFLLLLCFCVLDGRVVRSDSDILGFCLCFPLLLFACLVFINLVLFCWMLVSWQWLDRIDIHRSGHVSY